MSVAKYHRLMKRIFGCFCGPIKKNVSTEGATFIELILVLAFVVGGIFAAVLFWRQIGFRAFGPEAESRGTTPIIRARFVVENKRTGEWVDGNRLSLELDKISNTVQASESFRFGRACQYCLAALQVEIRFTGLVYQINSVQFVTDVDSSPIQTANVPDLGSSRYVSGCDNVDASDPVWDRLLVGVGGYFQGSMDEGTFKVAAGTYLSRELEGKACSGVVVFPGMAEPDFWDGQHWGPVASPPP